MENSGAAKGPGADWWRLYLVMPAVAILLVELLLLPLRNWLAWPIQVSVNQILLVLFSYLGSQAVLREIRDPSARRLTTWVGPKAADRLLRTKGLFHPLVLLLLCVRAGVFHGGLAGALIGANLLLQAFGYGPTTVSWAKLIYLAAGSAVFFAGFGGFIGAIAGAILLPIALRLLR